MLLLPFLMAMSEEPRPTRHGEDEHPVAIVGGLLRDGRMLWLWMTGLVMIAAAIGYAAWVPTYFVRVRGMDIATVGYLFGVANVVGGMSGGIIGGSLADRMRRRRLAGEMDVSAVAALLAVPFIVLTLLATSPGLFMVGAILAPMAAYAFFPSLQTVILEIVPAKNHGLAYAVNIFFLGGIGSALGPFIVGYVSDLTGSLLVAMSVSVVGIAMAAVMAWLTGRFVRARAAAL